MDGVKEPRRRSKREKVYDLYLIVKDHHKRINRENKSLKEGVLKRQTFVNKRFSGAAAGNGKVWFSFLKRKTEGINMSACSRKAASVDL